MFLFFRLQSKETLDGGGKVHNLDFDPSLPPFRHEPAKHQEWLSVLSDLRDPSTTPLNFTKSINLALSERGINSMKLADAGRLLEDVLRETIPMHGRMIHGRGKNGDLYEESQAYDAHGRVCIVILSGQLVFLTFCSI